MIDAAILAAIRARLDRALFVPAAGYRAFTIGETDVGCLDDARAARLAAFGPRYFHVGARRVVLDGRLDDPDARTDAIEDVVRTLRAEGALPGWRNERYRVANRFDERPLLHIERGAARYFGLRTWAAHVNGVAAGTMWFARRSHAKATDPGLLDNLVAGGIPAGMTVRAAMIKEAWEEAGIDTALAGTARAAGEVHVARALPDGLQRETILVHDLDVPAAFSPANQDGEAIAHRRVDLAEAARLIAVDGGDDEVTVDASVVVLDYLARHGEADAGGRLRAPDDV
ncbi:MAG: DUF4743 domain-containing protein [Betaproteobacteria bacterium]